MSRDIENLRKLSLNEDSGLGTPNSTTRNIPLASPTYRDGTMSPPPLQPDLQARVLAFQNKRMGRSQNNIQRSASMSDRGFGTNVNNFHTQPLAMQASTSTPVDKSLPPLPGSAPAFNLNMKKSGLSERRGMKLNMAEFNSAPASDQEVEVSEEVLPGITEQRSRELSRRFSSKKKPNFKLDLGDSNDANPQANAINGQKEKLPGMFAEYSKYIDIKKGELKFSGKASLHSKGVDFSSGHSFRISMEELEMLDELGRGNYGSVLKVRHKPTNIIMAMKEVRLELDETKFTQILMELDILHRCNSPYIVDFYGAFFSEGAVYMCMEYMDGGSLDKIYGKSYGVESEQSLAYITECIIRGLRELKDEHNIIHRDVKPTNILVNSNGKIKLCDFGVSGNLVASLAKTNIGCQSYMAPERIKTSNPADASYSVQSDVWSLGLSILEVACGHYPYPPETYDNIFSQLSAIVDGEPPKLNSEKFSKQAQMFVKLCLNKNPESRPTYSSLLNNLWLVKYRGIETNVAAEVTERLKQLSDEVNRMTIIRTDSGKEKVDISSPVKSSENTEHVKDLLKQKVKPPALHRTRLTRNANNNANASFANR